MKKVLGRQITMGEVALRWGRTGARSAFYTGVVV
jgi:hypothetical protein